MMKNKILTIFFAFILLCINSVVYATDTETKDKVDSDVVETNVENTEISSSKTEEKSADAEETSTDEEPEEESEEDEEPDCD